MRLTNVKEDHLLEPPEALENRPVLRHLQPPLFRLNLTVQLGQPVHASPVFPEALAHPCPPPKATEQLRQFCVLGGSCRR